MTDQEMSKMQRQIQQLFDRVRKLEQSDDISLDDVVEKTVRKPYAS